MREGKEGGGKKAKVDKNWMLGFESSHACRPRNVSSRDRCVNGLTTRGEHRLERNYFPISRPLIPRLFCPSQPLRFDAFLRRVMEN